MLLLLLVTFTPRYGEVMDVNLPRDKETGKTKGFGFLMYEDQRSTVLAVDNLNGAQVLDKTLRVDHVRNYKQPKAKGEDGEWIEREEQSLNAKPEMIIGTFILLIMLNPSANNCIGDDASSESSISSGPEIDPEDPMASYLLQKHKEEKARKRVKKTKARRKKEDETPEERRERKERKRARKELKALKKSLESKSAKDGGRSRVHESDHRKERSPLSISRDRREDYEESSRSSRRHSPPRR